MIRPTWDRGSAVPIGHARAEQLRCGLCAERFAPGDKTVRVDDERCHRVCAEDYADNGGVVLFDHEHDARDDGDFDEAA